MQKKYLLLKKAVFLLFFLVAYNSYSQTTFTASKSGKWGVLSTWGTSATKLPTLLDNVNIASGIVVTVSANAECKDLTITNGLNQSTSTVSVESMGTLSIGGDFSITSENGNRKSLLSNYGIIEFGKIVSFGTNTNTEYTIGLNSTFVYNGGNQTIVEIPGPISYPNLTISGSGIKKYNINIATTLNTLTVDSGTSLLLDGTSSLTPISAIINGTVVVQNTASLVKGTGAISFNSGSTYEHSQNAGTIPTANWNATSTCLFTGVTANIPTGIGQTFGNFTWDNVGQSADLSIASNLINIKGDLSVKSTGANKLILSNTGSSTLNVGGAFTMSGGTFDVNANTSGGTGTLNVGGDFSISGTSVFTESGIGTANVNYNGTGTQFFSKTGGTISNTINFTIISGATVNFGTSVLDGSDGTFNLNSGGSIITANPQGISNTGLSGSIQLTGTRTYNNTANYTYNGTSAQITGNGLTGANNLSVNNSAGLVLSVPTSVSGNVTLTNGILKSSSTNAFTVTNNSTTAITGASATTFIDGPLIWQLTIGKTYSFPIGKVNTYLPFGLTGITGTAPRIQVEASMGNSTGTALFPLASLSTTEYWEASVISGTFIGGSVSLTRQTALSGLDIIGRSATQAGDYTSLNGTLSGNSINSSDNTGNSLGFFVMAEKYKIFTGTISSASICEGTSVSIPYTIIGNYYPGNDFTAQLSDATGDFTATVNIGTLKSTAAGTISGLIPIGTVAGNGYRIRVISSNPGVIGTGNGINLTVKSKPNAPTVSNNGPVCVGCTLNLSASTVAGATYNWTGPNSFTSMQQNPSLTNVSTAMAGTYTVTVTVNACISNVASTNVIVNTSYNWTGNTNSDWNTASNWECNSIPNLNLNVIIPGGLTNYPTLNTGALGMAKDIQINSGATLTIIDNTLQIAGSTSNSGTFNSLNGSLAFVGTVAQTIPANTFSSNRIRNLIINNTADVSSLGDLEITGFLRVEKGNFNTGNMLRLISNTTQTALIDGSGNGQVVGTVKMQRYLDEAFGYKYFSSPFSNTKVGDFSPYLYLVDPDTSFPNFYTYDENRQYDADSASTGWEAYTTASDPLGILKAYALNFGDTLASPKTVEITGTVNNEYQEITLYNNDRLYTKGFNLVGNPYPSPIDWNAAGWTKTNIDDALYFFTAGNTDQYTGTYSTYIGGISSDGKSSNIIPSMQGFFVRVTNPGSATLGVTNSVRTNNYTQEFLKGSEPEKAAFIRITAAFENELNTDPAVLYFPHFAKLSFEKDRDALKLMNTDISVPNLYSLTPENKKLSINALPKPGSGDVKRIPLGLKTEKDGWMLIGLKELENLPSNFNVYLIDSEKRIGQNLSRKPLYRFYAKSGQHESRFHLMFSETEFSDPAMAFDEPFSVRTVGGKVMVSLNLESGQSGVLQASNVMGQILDRKNVSEKQIIEIDGIKSSGVYFISISQKDGMFSRKVLIQK